MNSVVSESIILDSYNLSKKSADDTRDQNKILTSNFRTYLNANTGRKNGLWVCMKTYLEKDCVFGALPTGQIWRCLIEESVMEVARWKNNVKTAATFSAWFLCKCTL